jgi:hypothetical protein
MTVVPTTVTTIELIFFVSLATSTFFLSSYDTGNDLSFSLSQVLNNS